MRIHKIDGSDWMVMIFIIVMGIVRVIVNFSPVISPVANFSPLGAMAIFGGAYFNKPWKAFGFPLFTLFISDVILHLTVYHSYGNGILYSGWYWVYGTFALMVLIGKILMKQKTFTRFILSSLFCVLIHWIITDYAVWLHSSIYAHTFKGYMDCLVAAIPFELRFLTGTFIYGGIMYLELKFEWVQWIGRKLHF